MTLPSKRPGTQQRSGSSGLPDPIDAARAAGAADAAPDKSGMRIFDKVASFTRARELQERGLYPYFKPITQCNGTMLVIEGEPRLNMGSNNYLGLTHDPRVLEAGKQAVDKYGSGCTGSRFLNGTMDLHERLEAELSGFLGRQAAIVFPTGYQANLGMISGLVGRDDTILIDKADHASIIDGTRLCFGRVKRFRHGDLEQLEQLLSQQSGSGLLIVVDGVHSMNGDITDLPGLTALAQRHGAALAVDDAHGVGILGRNGEGTPAHYDLTEQVDIVVGTFSKSLASIGGFVAADEDVIHYLKHNSRPLMFSAALPPFSVATVLEALSIVVSEPERRENLWRNTRHMTQGLKGLGFDLGPTETPILPIIIGEDELTFVFWRRLFEEGVFTNPVVSPAVPPDQGRLRVSLIATHELEQLDRALESLGKVGRELGVI
jgi:8-amino-7-oxononanoate synthase